MFAGRKGQVWRSRAVRIAGRTDSARPGNVFSCVLRCRREISVGKTKYAFCSSHHYIIPHPRAGDNTLSNKTFGHKTKITLPLPSVLFYILLFLYDRSFLTAITFACAGAHELGHMAAARLCGVGITGMTLYPFGADIRLDSPLRSYRKDFFISSGGNCGKSCACRQYPVQYPPERSDAR